MSTNQIQRIATGYNKIRANGFVADVEGYAFNTSPTQPSYATTKYVQLWYASLLGPEATVRAIWATLVSNNRRTATLYQDQAKGLLLPPIQANFANGGVTKTITTLPTSRVRHMGLFDNSVFRKPMARSNTNCITLILNKPEAAVNADEWGNLQHELYYRFNARSSLPLLPAWSGWLWEHLTGIRVLRQLDAGGNCTAFQLTISPEIIKELAVEVQAALRSGQLTA